MAKKDLGYIEGYLGEDDAARDLIDVKLPGLRYSLPVVKYDPEGGLTFPWLPRDSNEPMAPTLGDILQQTIPDSAASKFKYGLEKNPSLSYFEDPTYLAYDLIFDVDSSPLFNKKHPNGVYRFMNDYVEMMEVSSRLHNDPGIYDEFLNRFWTIFQGDFKKDPNTDAVPRTYYAESIEGLDKLNAKIVNYGEDKLTITLTEDLSMSALYLAELYNNLVYSYKSQKYIIPDNCIRFDMLIKITDMREIKTLTPDDSTPSVDESSKKFPKKSFIIYRLHDCNFDFFNSMTIDNSITIGGFNLTSIDQNPASLKFDIYYKSISREMTPSLIPNSATLRNKMIDLSEPVAQDRELFENMDAERAEEERWQNMIRNKIKEVPKAISDLGTSLKNRYQEVRGEMLSELISTVKERIRRNETAQNLGLDRFHHPPNVYEDDIFEKALTFVKDLLAGETTTDPMVRREIERQIKPPPDLDDKIGGRSNISSVDRREYERKELPIDIDNNPTPLIDIDGTIVGTKWAGDRDKIPPYNIYYGWSMMRRSEEDETENSLNISG